MNAIGQTEAASAAVVAAFQSLVSEHELQLTVKVRLARAARDAALRSVMADPTPTVRLDELTEPQRTVLHLVTVHRFLGTEVGEVLRLDLRVVGRLANEGLATLGSSSSQEA